MTPIQGLFWMKQGPLKIVPMGSEAGIPLTNQLIHPHCKEILGLLLESLPHHGLHIFVQPRPLPFSTFLKGPKTQSHMGEHSMPWTVQTTWGTGTVQRTTPLMNMLNFLSDGQQPSATRNSSSLVLFGWILHPDHWHLNVTVPTCSNVPILLHTSWSPADVFHAHSHKSPPTCCICQQHCKHVSCEQPSQYYLWHLG